MYDPNTVNSDYLEQIRKRQVPAVNAVPQPTGPGFTVSQLHNESDAGRRFGAGALNAVSQAFANVPQVTPVPQADTNNEAERRARMGMLNQLPMYRNGGYVKKDDPVIIGDGSGPEVFVPNKDGRIIPNPQDTVPTDWGKGGIPRAGASMAPPWQQAPSNPVTLPVVTAPIAPTVVNQVPDSPPQNVSANIPSVPAVTAPPIPQPNVPGVTLPTVTAPETPNFGWNSDTSAMKDQRAYDASRPPTLDEAQTNYNSILSKPEHPNKFLSGLFLALEGLSHIANPNNQQPYQTLGQARKNVKLDSAGRVVKTLQDQAEFQIGQKYKNKLITNIDRDNDRQDQEVINHANKLVYDQLSDAQKQVVDVYKEIDDFNPTSPDNKELADRATKLGVTLVPKKKGDKYTFQMSPDGHVVVGNTSTGEYKAGNETFVKPPTITADELKDTLFPGLKTKEQISSEVDAQVGPLPEGRRLKPEAAANLPTQYKNPDGSINEQQLWADYFAAPEFNRPPDPSRYYENLPSDYSQRKAIVMKKALAANAPTQEAVDKFRLALSNHTPSANAVAVPLTTIVDGFGQILGIKNSKQRKIALEKYYKEILPNIKVGR